MTETTEVSPTEIIPELATKLAYMQQLQFWLIFMEPTDKWGIIGESSQAFILRDQPLLLRHLEWLEALEADGKLFLSGPVGLPAWDGSGMAVVRAESLESAQALAETEPFHITGHRRNSVRSWNVNEGALFLRIDVMSGRGRIS